MTKDDADAVEVVFGLPELLRHILRYLPVNDLLNCSLVNRHWNSHARFSLERLKKNKDLITVSGWRACESLHNLAMSLNPGLGSVPRSGLRILGGLEDSHGPRCIQPFINEEGLLYRTLTQYFPIWFFELSCIGFHYCWVLEGLIDSILTAPENQLVELSIMTRWSLSDTSKAAKSSWPLSKLRILRVQLDWPENVELTRRIFRSAPNLTEFYPSCHYNRLHRGLPWNSVLFFDKPKILKTFYFTSSRGLDGWERLRAEDSQPKLARLYLPGSDGVQTNKPSTLSQMGKILSWNASYLTTLHVHQIVFSRILDLSQCPPLTQLTALGVHRSAGWELKAIQNLTVRLQVHAPRLFPRLKHLELRHGLFLMQSGLEQEVEDDLVSHWKGGGRKVVTITSIALTSDGEILPAISGKPECLQFLHQQFSALTDLTLIYDATFCDQLQLGGGVWEHCSQLVKLSILHYQRGDYNYSNGVEWSLDSEFCGITREEAEMISRSNFSPNALGKLQFVPLRPSITWLKGLRTLCLDNYLSRSISLLTVHLALSRMRKLRVFYGCGAGNYCINDINDEPHVEVPVQVDWAARNRSPLLAGR